MKIQVCTDSYDKKRLKKYKPKASFNKWEHVISGHWDDSPDHSGHIHFFLANTSSGVWVLQCNERRSENIVAVCEEAPDDLAAKEIAKILYEAVEEDGGKVVDEPTDYGLIDW